MLSEEKIAKTAKLISVYLDRAPATVVNELDEIFIAINTLEQQNKQMKEALVRIAETEWDDRIDKIDIEYAWEMQNIAKSILQSLQGSDTK